MLNFIFYQFGQVTPPEAIGRFDPVEQGGLGQFLNLILNLLVVGGAIYALLHSCRLYVLYGCRRS
jgi:hypothetical protein